MEVRAEVQSRSDRPRIAIAVCGSLLLIAVLLTRLPWGRDEFRLPATPLDRTRSRFMAPGYLLLLESASRIPPGASVAVVGPADALTHDLFWRFAVALLPDRRILPDSVGADPEHATPAGADYLVLWGPASPTSHGTLLLSEPQGSVWRLESSR